MKGGRTLLILGFPWVLISCSVTEEQGTLAELRDVELALEDTQVNDGLDKAMASYRVFLEETPESAMTPEAIRRIADLSIEKEYGYINEKGGGQTAAATTLDTPATAQLQLEDTAGLVPAEAQDNDRESDQDFESRAAEMPLMTSSQGPKGESPALTGHPAGDLENANARQAITLYKKLLHEYPLYDRNDQVLYQMSRAYEELGEIDEAMRVMNQFIQAYPNSRYMDEVQFRRAEFFFTRKQYLNAEQAYQTIVAMGPGSYYYELALYKLGWSFYKQHLYDEALSQYIALLDYKVSIGYDFDQAHDPIESKLVDDTYRVISLSFSNLGGPEVVAEFFGRVGARSYEDKVYSNLGEFYLDKRRYADAAGAYKTFIDGHPYAEISPHFAMRVIEIYHQGRFAQLVIEAKKDFSYTYALDADYWQHFQLEERPDVVGFLKGNLKDLANHYHALYQDKRFAKEKPVNYREALVWYRKYLSSFPQAEESPSIHYQLADLMMENKDFGGAAQAYEFTSYGYPQHEQSSAAGYAAVYAYREHLKTVVEVNRDVIQQKVVDTSLKFADTYPQHEKVTLVLGAAADDLYKIKNYSLAVTTARKLLEGYPQAEMPIRRSAWLVVAHGSFDLQNYFDAEHGYLQVLELTAEDDKTRTELVDNLAAAIYKQGEASNQAGEFQLAAEHFLRVGRLAPTSGIRPNAEFDAATALIELQNWSQATAVLQGFREQFGGHELQSEITKKMAFVYKSDGKAELAGAEYERIANESDDDEVGRGALLLAADLYEQAGVQAKQLSVYQRFVKRFPAPLESALEIYNKMAAVYLLQHDDRNRTATLKTIVQLDRKAGNDRTDRTKYLAAEASLVLVQPQFDEFNTVNIVEPIKKSLDVKKRLMKKAINGYTALLDYEVADVTAAATYHMAEIYYNFSRSLMASERPKNLNELELEQYELALEDQIYPFEEKAIDVHRKNVELLYVGVYNPWVDKSIEKLADMFPALYDRDEVHSDYVETIDSFLYTHVIKQSEELVKDSAESVVDSEEHPKAEPVIEADVETTVSSL